MSAPCAVAHWDQPKSRRCAEYGVFDHLIHFFKEVLVAVDEFIECSDPILWRSACLN